jgi:hypothetical protein
MTAPIRTATVAALSHDELQVRITWTDGHNSIFDSLWLRDNRAEDRHPTTGQRLVDIADLPADPKLRLVRPGDNHMLEIFWVGDTRSARFSSHWLRSHCYCGEHGCSPAPAPALWRGSNGGVAQLRDRRRAPSARPREALAFEAC